MIEQYVVTAIGLFLREISFTLSDKLFVSSDISLPLRDISFFHNDLSFQL